jgi:hypothetical protein
MSHIYLLLFLTHMPGLAAEVRVMDSMSACEGVYQSQGLPPDFRTISAFCVTEREVREQLAVSRCDVASVLSPKDYAYTCEAEPLPPEYQVLPGVAPKKRWEGAPQQHVVP